MANIKSAVKRARQSEERHDHNTAVISGLRSRQKALRDALKDGDAAAVKEKYQALTASLDKAAKRGIIHANAASRRKARFNRLITTAAKA